MTRRLVFLLPLLANSEGEACSEPAGCATQPLASLLQQRVALKKRGAKAAVGGLQNEATRGHQRRAPSHSAGTKAPGPSPWHWAYVATSVLLGPLLWALAPRGREAATADGGSIAVKGGGEERVAYLDFWRVLCVSVMVISHAGGQWEAYVEYNMLGGQQWVLPIVILVSGICYGRTTMPALPCVARLLTYFAFGSLLNFLSAVAAGSNWWDEVATRGVTFQMFYVLGLAALALLLAPLKASLRARMVDGQQPQPGLGLYGYSALLLLAASIAGLAFGQRPSQLLRILAESSATVLLAAAGLRNLTDERVDLLGWLLLAWIYTTRIAHAEPRPGTEFHLCDLFVVALVTQHVPLRGQAKVGLAIVGWWPVLCFVCGFLLHPGLRERLDLSPPDSLLERLRHYVVEAVAVLAFITIPAAGPDRTITFPDSLRKQLPWANRWALFAYCSHYAIYRVVPAQTVGVPLVFLLAPVFAVVQWLVPTEPKLELAQEGT